MNYYWVIRFKRKGRRRPQPLVSTVQYTRAASIKALLEPHESWNKVKRESGLECVKVRLDTEYYNNE
jgi:hypothetical protein